MSDTDQDLRFGIHSGQLHGSVEAMVELWTYVEDAGYDWVSLFDFLRPWAFDTDKPCFEGPTLLAALAARTSRIRCGLLVSPVTWRHPALMANIASTLDHVSGGRLEFGVGAGGTDRGYSQYGIPFPPDGTRLDMLDEACTVLRRLWTEREVDFRGRHFTLDRATLEPKPLQERLPLVVGGDGVRRTIPIAARHADVWNALPESPQAYAVKSDLLDAACARIGRDPREIRKSMTYRAVVTRHATETARRREEELVGLPDYQLEQYVSFGTVDECVAALRPYVENGVRDLLLAVKAPVDWGTIDLVVTEVAPRLREIAAAL